MAETVAPLATARIHRALSRPNHLMGADRELVLLTGLAAVILMFATHILPADAMPLAKQEPEQRAGQGGRGAIERQ